MVKCGPLPTYPPLTPEVLDHHNNAGLASAEWLTDHPVQWNSTQHVSSITFPSNCMPRAVAFHVSSGLLAVGLKSQVQLFRRASTSNEHVEWQIVEQFHFDRNSLPESLSKHPDLSLDMDYLEFSPSGKMLLVSVKSRLFEEPVPGFPKLTKSNYLNPPSTFLINLNQDLNRTSQTCFRFIGRMQVLEESRHFSSNEELLFLENFNNNTLYVFETSTLKDLSSSYPHLSLHSTGVLQSYQGSLHLITATKNGLVRRIDPFTREERYVSGDSGEKYYMRISPDSKLLVVVSRRENVTRGFNLETLKHEFALRNLSKDRDFRRSRDLNFVKTVAMDPSMNYLAVGDVKGALSIYDLKSKIPTIHEKTLNLIHHFTFNPVVPSSVLSSNPRLWGVSFPEFFNYGDIPIHSIEFSPDSTKIAFNSIGAGGVVIYDFHKNQLQGLSQPLPRPEDSWKKGEEDEKQWKGWFKGGARFKWVGENELVTRGNDLLLGKEPELRFWKIM